MKKEKIKLLSYHPFSLYSTGGGSRILRRLYNGHEKDIKCLVLQESVGSVEKGDIPQIVIKQFPLHRPWYRSRLRTVTIWLRNIAFKNQTIKKIKAAENTIDYDIIHIVDHGPLSGVLCKQIKAQKKELWVSFHDYFSTSRSSYNDAKELWNLASRRLVISNEMGIEYSRLFGSLGFEVFTDGVYKEELSSPRELFDKAALITVYFAGLLHLDYLPLFKVLADAIELLINEGYTIELVLRGTQRVDFLNNRNFKIIYKPVSLDSRELKSELDQASILYLPIKFTDPLFHLYSMSTKMVGYLGASGAILYHGPGNSAAANLLSDAKAAVCNSSFDANKLAESIRELITNHKQLSQNAKRLAEQKFDLLKMKSQFWKI